MKNVIVHGFKILGIRDKKGQVTRSFEKIGKLRFFYMFRISKSNQGNQGYSGNQKNAMQGQRPDIENRHTQQRI